jgi:hypothetical protein
MFNCVEEHSIERIANKVPKSEPQKIALKSLSLIYDRGRDNWLSHP